MYIIKYKDEKTGDIIKVHPWSKRVQELDKDKRYSRMFEE